MWFQQNSVTCSITQANMALLQETFPGRVIFRRGDINWPPRSCDLTPLDLFSWGYAKDRFYVDKLSTLEHLKDSIRHVLAEISQNMCPKSGQKLPQKNHCLQHSAWRSLNDVVFHTYYVNVQAYNKKELSWKKYFACILFTCTFEATKWKTRHFKYF